MFDTRFTESCGLLILYAAPDRPTEVDAERYLAENDIRGMKYVALFDYQAAGTMTSEDLLWLAAANTDPRRDVRHLTGGELLIDARSKRPAVGDNPARFPNVAASSTETIRMVDGRWEEYGLGKRIESPSRRYRKLQLSAKAEW